MKGANILNPKCTTFLRIINEIIKLTIFQKLITFFFIPAKGNGHLRDSHARGENPHTQGVKLIHARRDC